MSECANCGEPRPPKGGWRKGWACGYCPACYKRWRRHGSPAGGPPPPRPRAPRAARAGRVEDYTDLRSWGIPDSQAAERLGVSVRTLLRYKRDLREAS